MVHSLRRNGRKSNVSGSTWVRHDHALCLSSQNVSQAVRATTNHELGTSLKKVAKWSKRATSEDLKTGLKAPHTTNSTEADEALAMPFRRHALPWESVCKRRSLRSRI